jgi:endonuclease G
LATGTPNFKEAVERAIERADTLGEDLVDLTERVRTSLPEELNNPKQMRARQRFLESIYDESREAEQAYERIIGGNELQDANFLARGALVARTVLRIVIRGGGGRVLGYGTGSLIGDGVLLTNNHVLPSSDAARASYAEAFYERGLEGQDAQTLRFALQPDRVWYTSKALDFSIVGIADADSSGATSARTLGWLPLIGTTGKVVEGEWMTIVQHPKGERKQLCVRDNQLLKCDTDVLWYSTDTLGGSSGSPVFNNDWLMVALHHSGVPEVKGGKWQTVDGRDYDQNRDDESKIKWIANEGIRISRILETLRIDNAIANNRLVDPILKMVVGDVQVRLPVLYSTEAHRSAAVAALVPSPASSAPPNSPRAAPAGGGGQVKPTRESSMSKRRITVTLEIDEDGRVTLEGGGAVESSLLEARPSRPKLQIEAPVDQSTDWVHGFDTAFLGEDHIVDLPTVTPSIAGTVAPLKRESVYRLPEPDDEAAKAGVLHYNGFSVVMNKFRRLAIYSAANINGGVEFNNITRPPDVWLFDDRIDRTHQIGNVMYKNNKLDRGHLTRREDMEWGGDPVEATRRANGTCTWTNCAPQHSVFNQDKHPDKVTRLWGGLEKYVLEKTARHHQFRVQAFSGPIFHEEDPHYRGVQIPLDFWKVVVAVDARGELFATGYILTQRLVLDMADLEEAAVEEPFGAFQTYQQPIGEIEKATGLKFTARGGKELSAFDPLTAELAKKPWERRHRRAPGPGAQESVIPVSVTAPEAPLESFSDILLADF